MCLGKFSNYIKAGYALLWVKTHEEFRVLTDYVNQISGIKVADGDLKYETYTWDVADGIRKIGIKDGVLASGEALEGTASDPLNPLTWLDEKAEDNTIMFLKDYNPFLQKEFQDSIFLHRKIRNSIGKFRAKGKVLVILSTDVQIPQDLDKEITVLDYKLPTRDDLKIVLKACCEFSEAPYPANDEELIDAALGMTSFEAENAFSISLVESKKYDAAIIRREKSSIVKKTGLLEVINSTYTLDDIGGLELLKDWLRARKDCFSTTAKEFGISPPKGLLMVGVPGGGKSLSAKAVATVWGRPLVRLDMGRIFGSYVGESENNMRRCLDIAEAVSPCILWMDELEKSLSGNKAGMESHETTRRVFQELLTWMQERTSDVFLVATANSVESLPPELLRAGRIDAIFWVDLPDMVQREEIIKIHLKKRGRNPNMFGGKITELVKVSEGFTGAEIEVWIMESLVRAFSQKHKDLQLDDLLATVLEITPISKLMETDIQNARNWAKNRGTKMASITHKPKSDNDGKRKMNLL
jgi:SpoVK/Ycf46/Vps4 family AAA+-type ATPase